MGLSDQEWRRTPRAGALATPAPGTTLRRGVICIRVEPFVSLKARLEFGDQPALLGGGLFRPLRPLSLGFRAITLGLQPAQGRLFARRQDEAIRQRPAQPVRLDAL